MTTPAIVPTISSARHRFGADAELLEDEADHDRRADGDQARRDHLPQRAARDDVDRAAVVGLLGALHDARMLLELRPDVLDDDARGLADRLDRQAREEEHEHRADETSDEHFGLGEVDRGQLRAVVLELVEIRREEQERGERRGPDRVALGQGLGRVADGVQAIGLLPNRLGLLGHLDDAAGVVGDRAERVHRQDVGRRHQHPHRRDRGAEDAAPGSACVPIL